MKPKSVMSQIELIAVGETSIRKAELRVAACQDCSASVSQPFGSVLTEVLGAMDPSAEYFLGAEAHCPNCLRAISESTLVRCEGERQEGMETGLKEYQPSWDETNVVLVNEDVLSQAQQYLTGCEKCVSSAEMTFDYLLDAVTGRDPSVTEYVLCHAVKCPRCDHEVTEKTLVIAH